MIKKLKLLIVIAASTLSLNANAAVDMFLVLANFNGETQDSQYYAEHGIDILAWSWGMSQSGTTHIGAGSGAGKASVQDITLTKYVDTSSTQFIEYLVQGKHILDGRLVVHRAGEVRGGYMLIELEDIIVTSVSTGGDGGEDRLTENITLNFRQFTSTYTKVTPGGVFEDTDPFCYDIAEQTEC